MLIKDLLNYTLDQIINISLGKEPPQRLLELIEILNFLDANPFTFVQLEGKTIEFDCIKNSVILELKTRIEANRIRDYWNVSQIRNQAEALIKENRGNYITLLRKIIGDYCSLESRIFFDWLALILPKNTLIEYDLLALYIKYPQLYFVKQEIMENRDGDGNTILHSLAESTNKGIEYFNLLCIFLSNSNDFNVQNNRGETFLHILIKKEFPVLRIVDVINMYGIRCDLAIQDVEGNTVAEFLKKNETIIRQAAFNTNVVQPPSKIKEAKITPSGPIIPNTTNTNIAQQTPKIVPSSQQNTNRQQNQATSLSSNNMNLGFGIDFIPETSNTSAQKNVELDKEKRIEEIFTELNSIGCNRIECLNNLLIVVQEIQLKYLLEKCYEGLKNYVYKINQIAEEALNSTERVRILCVCIQISAEISEKLSQNDPYNEALMKELMFFLKEEHINSISCQHLVDIFLDLTQVYWQGFIQNKSKGFDFIKKSILVIISKLNEKLKIFLSEVELNPLLELERIIKTFLKMPFAYKKQELDQKILKELLIPMVDQFFNNWEEKIIEKKDIKLVGLIDKDYSLIYKHDTFRAIAQPKIGNLVKHFSENAPAKDITDKLIEIQEKLQKPRETDKELCKEFFEGANSSMKNLFQRIMLNDPDIGPQHLKQLLDTHKAFFENNTLAVLQLFQISIEDFIKGHSRFHDVVKSFLKEMIGKPLNTVSKQTSEMTIEEIEKIADDLLKQNVELKKDISETEATVYKDRLDGLFGENSILNNLMFPLTPGMQLVFNLKADFLEPNKDLFSSYLPAVKCLLKKIELFNDIPEYKGLASEIEDFLRKNSLPAIQNLLPIQNEKKRKGEGDKNEHGNYSSGFFKKFKKEVKSKENEEDFERLCNFLGEAVNAKPDEQAVRRLNAIFGIYGDNIKTENGFYKIFDEHCIQGYSNWAFAAQAKIYDFVKDCAVDNLKFEEALKKIAPPVERSSISITNIS